MKFKIICICIGMLIILKEVFTNTQIHHYRNIPTIGWQTTTRLITPKHVFTISGS